MINIFNNIKKKILDKEKIKCRTINIPPIKPKKNKKGYSQLRGLLYILSVGALLEIHKGSNLVITECGTTMYQPLFGIYDSITHTTHPTILKTANRILSTVTQRRIKFILPYEDMTKAEIIANSKEAGLLPETHSCITSRFRNHCGICYGCVLRRLGAILVGVKDADYKYDILAEHKSDDDNLISLLRFSYYFITDISKLPDYSTEKIIKNKKQDLFKRQSLDIISTMYVLNKESYPLSSRLKKAYEIYVKPIDEKIIKKRIKDVRLGSKKPDFTKII